jgi:hypothetical protein
MTQDTELRKRQSLKKNNAISPLTKRAKKNYYDSLSDPFNPVRGEKALWVAVITQAMQDALNRATNAEALYHKHEATHWLTSNSKDFVTVCLFAGLDPDYVRRMAKRSLANPTLWRAEAGTGKRYQERKAYRKRLKEKAKQTEPAAPPALLLTLVKGSKA